MADLPTVELPTDKPRPPVSTFQGASQDFALPAALSDDLAALSRREGATLFMMLLAVWQILLVRYSGQDGIVVGTPIANRTRGEIEGLIGFFVNTLVLRAELPDMLTFRAALKQVRKVCLDAYAHQDLPFEQVVEALAPGRDTSRHPLFQVMFALQNAPLAPLDLPGLSIRPMAIAGQTAKFDLSLVLAAMPGGLVGTFEYRTDLFDPATISRMHGHYRTLLEAIVARPDQRLVDLPLLTMAEHAQLAGWNATRTGVRSQESGVRSEAPGSWSSASDSFCTHHLVEAQAARTPDAVAVIFDGGQGSGVGGRGSEDKETSRQGDKQTRRLGALPSLNPQSSVLSP